MNNHLNHDDIEDEDPHGPEYCTACQNEDIGVNVRREERGASLIIAKKLLRLESVGWSSFFGSGKDVMKMEGGDLERATTIYILRENGRIKARGRPW